MSSTVRLLTVLFVIQIGLIGWMYSDETSLDTFKSKEGLLSQSIDKISKIIIEEEGKSPLELSKDESGWVLPASSSMPATKTKVKSLLSDLMKLKISFPVAKTKGARKQLEVSEDNFERKIQLVGEDGRSETLYLGTSPSFKRVHIRVDGQEPIYSVALNAQEISTKVKDWSDPELLKFDPETVTEVSLGELKIAQKGDRYLSDGLKEDEEIVKVDLMKKLLKPLSSLSYEKVLGVEDKDEYKQDSPVFVAKLKLADKELSYTVSAPKEGDFYVVKSSSYPYFFEVKKGKIERLKSVTLDDIVSAKVIDVIEEEEMPAEVEQESSEEVEQKDTLSKLNQVEESSDK